MQNGELHLGLCQAPCREMDVPRPPLADTTFLVGCECGGREGSALVEIGTGVGRVNVSSNCAQSGDAAGDGQERETFSLRRSGIY